MDVSITIPAQTITIPEETVDVTIPVAGIVYQNSWLSQTADIASIPIFTPSANGVFRVTIAGDIYGIANTNNGSVVVDAGISYYPFLPNDVGYLNLTLNFLGNPNKTYDTLGSSYIVFANANEPINFSSIISYNESARLNYYDVYVTIEQLQ